MYAIFVCYYIGIIFMYIKHVVKFDNN